MVEILRNRLAVIAALHPFVVEIAVAGRQDDLRARAGTTADDGMLLLHHEDVVEALLPLRAVADVLEIAGHVLLPVEIVRLHPEELRGILRGEHHACDLRIAEVRPIGPLLLLRLRENLVLVTRTVHTGPEIALERKPRRPLDGEAVHGQAVRPEPSDLTERMRHLRELLARQSQDDVHVDVLETKGTRERILLDDLLHAVLPADQVEGLLAEGLRVHRDPVDTGRLQDLELLPRDGIRSPCLHRELDDARHPRHGMHPRGIVHVRRCRLRQCFRRDIITLLSVVSRRCGRAQDGDIGLPTDLVDEIHQDLQPVLVERCRRAAADVDGLQRAVQFPAHVVHGEAELLPEILHIVAEALLPGVDRVAEEGAVETAGRAERDADVEAPALFIAPTGRLADAIEDALLPDRDVDHEIELLTADAVLFPEIRTDLPERLLRKILPRQCLQQRAHEGHRTDTGEVAPWELLPGHADQGVVEFSLDDGLVLLPDTRQRKRGGLHGEAQADAVLLHALRGDLGRHTRAVLRGLLIDGGHLTGGLRLLQRIFLLLGGV